MRCFSLLSLFLILPVLLQAQRQTAPLQPGDHVRIRSGHSTTFRGTVERAGPGSLAVRAAGGIPVVAANLGLKPGEHVRVSGRGAPVEVSVERAEPGTLLLRANVGVLPVILPDSMLSNLEVLRTAGTSAGGGLAIGFGIGAGLGLLMAADISNKSGSFSETGTGDLVAVAGIVAGIGGAAGLIIGALTPHHVWRPVRRDLRPITPTVTSIRGRPGLGLRVAF